MLDLSRFTTRRGMLRRLKQLPEQKTQVESQELQAWSGMPEIESRPADSHKGDYGRLLFIGGCRNMSGAIAMAASAALRSGAGLVSVATAEPAQSVVANYNPCYMTVGVEEDPQGRMAVSAETAEPRSPRGSREFRCACDWPGDGTERIRTGLGDRIVS